MFYVFNIHRLLDYDTQVLKLIRKITKFISNE